LDKLVNISNGLMLLTAFCAAALLPLNSCDDAGVNPYAIPAGRITITHQKLRPVDESIQGKYWLWISIDTSLGLFWKKIGSFNVAPDGSLNPSTFELGFDSLYINTIQGAFVSVGFDSVQDVNPHLVAGAISQYQDSAGGILVMNDNNAVGPAIDSFLTVAPGGMYDNKYILLQPTANSNCKSGIWFCDPQGNFTMWWAQALDSSSRWIYEGWVIDTTGSSWQTLSTGKFLDPNSLDEDGAGACSGSNPLPFNKPGQDWVQQGGTCPGEFNIDDVKHWIYLTLEPRNELPGARGKPFPVTLAWQKQNPIECNTPRDGLQKSLGWGILPIRVHIRIEK
jgi:hypothetical protein